MDFKSGMQDQMEMSRNVHDFKGLDKLRQAAQSGDKGALEEAAKQFEAIFVQMMLKSMRQAQDILADEDSPFNSDQVKFYRDMHDQQMATDLSTKGSVGLADVIVKQLGYNDNYTPASLLRNDGDLGDINRARRAALEKVATTWAPEVPKVASKQAAFAKPDEFVQALYPLAKKYAARLGIEERALLAQAAVETGWGQHMIHQGEDNNSHNLFGIKANHGWQGKTAVVNTLEFEHGVAKQQRASFRSYPSFDAAMSDYVDFISTNPRYAEALKQAQDPKAYFDALQQGGYATDPQYADKVMAVMDSPALKRIHASEEAAK